MVQKSTVMWMLSKLGYTTTAAIPPMTKRLGVRYRAACESKKNKRGHGGLSGQCAKQSRAVGTVCQPVWRQEGGGPCLLSSCNKHLLVSPVDQNQLENGHQAIQRCQGTDLDQSEDIHLVSSFPN